MEAIVFKELNLEYFIDQYGTKFVKGPFIINGIEYDYKLIDEQGEDYCTCEQIEEWFCDIVTKGPYKETK